LAESGVLLAIDQGSFPFVIKHDNAVWIIPTIKPYLNEGWLFLTILNIEAWRKCILWLIINVM
jgi:hypothetical protein